MRRKHQNSLKFSIVFGVLLVILIRLNCLTIFRPLATYGPTDTPHFAPPLMRSREVPRQGKRTSAELGAESLANFIHPDFAQQILDLPHKIRLPTTTGIGLERPKPVKTPTMCKQNINQQAFCLGVFYLIELVELRFIAW